MYRPPPSQQNNLSTTGFLTEWAEFLSHQTTAVAELIIVGDLNIHLDNNELHYSQRMQQTIESCGLQQHIDQAIDILITRDTSNIVAACEVRDVGLCDNVRNLINGHFALIAKICYSSFKHKHQDVTFRRYKDINVAQFRTDILTSPSLTECSVSTDDVVKRYITRISALINTHAPFIHRTITPRPNAPWIQRLCAMPNIFVELMSVNGGDQIVMQINIYIEFNVLSLPKQYITLKQILLLQNRRI